MAGGYQFKSRAAALATWAQWLCEFWLLRPDHVGLDVLDDLPGVIVPHTDQVIDQGAFDGSHIFGLRWVTATGLSLRSQYPT